MAFFKFRKAKESRSGKAGRAAGGRGAQPEADLQDVRVRARHRLIGAVALVVLAVIGFPLLFDTEQRPAVIDAPVVIAGAPRDAALKSLPAIPAPSGETGAAAPADPPGAASAGEGEVETPGIADAEPGQITDADTDDDEPWTLGPEVEPLAEADTDTFVSGQEPSAVQSKIRVTPAQQPAREPVSSVPAPARTDGAGTGSRPRGASDDAEARRALAALQGRPAPQRAPPAAPSGQKGRFVVQVGAFSQEDQVRSVQQRIANAGLKSYTQVVQTGAGPRTRVRVGPYDSRDAAERARAALEKGGLPGQVLTP